MDDQFSGQVVREAARYLAKSRSCNITSEPNNRTVIRSPSLLLGEAISGRSELIADELVLYSASDVGFVVEG